MKNVLFLVPIVLLSFELSLLNKRKTPDEKNKVFSPNGEYYGSIIYEKGNSEYIPIAHFTLFHKTGRVIYKKEPFGHTLVDIADNGQVVGIDFDGPISGKATLHFYDQEGVKTGITTVGFLLQRGFSDNGHIYCVNDGHYGLRVFTADGKELYKLGKGNWYATSSCGKVIALAQDERMLLYREGKLVGQLPIPSPFIREMKLSNDGSLLSFVFRKSLYLYNTSDAKILFHYEEKNPKLNFISVDISPDNSLIIAGIEEDKGRGVANRRTRGFVYLFDHKGKLLLNEEIKYSNWNVFIPDVAFTGNRSFLVKTVDEIYEYELKEVR